MATPVNQPSKPANYLPWILGGCAILLFLGVVVAGVAGVVVYVMTPSDGSTRRIGLSTEKVKPVDAHGVQTVAKNWSRRVESLESNRGRDNQFNGGRPLG